MLNFNYATTYTSECASAIVLHFVSLSRIFNNFARTFHLSIPEKENNVE